MLTPERMDRLTEVTASLHGGDGKGGAVGAGDLDALVGRAVAGLGVLVDCDWVGVSLLMRHLPGVNRVWTAGGFDLEGLVAGSEVAPERNPVYTARLRRTLERAASFGRFVPDGALGASAYFNECLRPMGVRRLLACMNPGELNYTVLLGRGGGADFDALDESVVQAVGRHLDAATAALADRDGGCLTVEGRRVALQRYAWAVCDDAGRVIRADAHAGGRLERLGAGGAGRVPSVWRERLARRARGGPPEPVVLRDGMETVSVYMAPVRGAPGEHTATMLIEPARASDPWVAAGLTAREAEVLGWVASGKTNGEIGVILGISGLTVKKHVERVLEKTGANGRTAAAAWAVERM
jgi:DNA-binding CsgD family transcriptional regulator